ncbi:MAG: hypothetical protein ABI462_03490 [Ignavibacteria bacterium]
MKKLFAVFIFLFTIFSSLYAQDTISKDNKWFTEFLIANSSGFTLNLLNGTDLAIGRRIFKNTDLRIVGGFNVNNSDNNGRRSDPFEITDKYTSESSYDRYSTGLDILYRISIVKGLMFKTGPGYEYEFSQNEYEDHNIASDGTTRESKQKYKDYVNHFKLIGSFQYNFTGNIYVFIQGQVMYNRSHTTILSTSNIIYLEGGTYNYSQSSDYKQNSFQFDNFFLGGGITF